MTYTLRNASTYTLPTLNTGVLLKEDGDPILTEDGNELLLENPVQTMNLAGRNGPGVSILAGYAMGPLGCTYAADIVSGYTYPARH